MNNEQLRVFRKISAKKFQPLVERLLKFIPEEPLETSKVLGHKNAFDEFF